MNQNKIEIFSKNLKRKILDTAFKAGAKSAHLGGALSSSDIISVIFILLTSILMFQIIPTVIDLF